MNCVLAVIAKTRDAKLLLNLMDFMRHIRHQAVALASVFLYGILRCPCH